MARYNYSRLSAQDNDFLLWEKPNLPMHVSSVQIFQAGTLLNEDGGIDFEQIKRATQAVLHRMPRYRQKIHWIPGSSRAVWVDDAHFNIDYHMRHISLPRPGSDAQLKRMASRIMEYPLDRSRPLWETWVVEGLEGGRFATIAKTHHCMIDGASGMDLAGHLMSREPRSEIPDWPRFVPRPIPSDAVLRRDEQGRRWTAPQRFFRQLRDFAAGSENVIDEIGERARALGGMAQHKLNPASQTPINGSVGPHRIFDFTSVSLDGIKAIRKRYGVSVNDVVLAIVTGTVRRFMTLRSVDPNKLDFRVSSPVNVRTKDEKGKPGNRVSSWIVPLPLDEPDPAKQLARIHEKTRELKDSHQSSVIEMVNVLHEWIPIDLQSISTHTQNMIVTNVPGPQYPLYLLGAELMGMYPQPPLIENLGLVVGAISYNGQVCFGLNADHDRVPDLSDFTQGLLRSFEALSVAAAR